jgi:cell division protein FtsB
VQDKLKQLLDHPYASTLNDTRVLGLLGFGVIALLVTWSGIKSIETNYQLQKQISQLTQQNDVAKLENANQKLRNEYYKTDTFLELAARRQFGKAAPGETLYLVPKKVALAHTVSLPTEQAPRTPADNRPGWQKNLESWFQFFLHRQK